jgi:Holliday junction resolvasome RuvABC DNA-binding subunit
MSLGYSQAEAQKAVEKAMSKVEGEVCADALIRAALKKA